MWLCCLSLIYLIRAILGLVSTVGDYSTVSFNFVEVAIVHPMLVGLSEGMSFFLALKSAGACSALLCRVR